MYVCMYVCTHVCICMYACMYACMYVFGPRAGRGFDAQRSLTGSMVFEGGERQGWCQLLLLPVTIPPLSFIQVCYLEPA